MKEILHKAIVVALSLCDIINNTNEVVPDVIRQHLVSAMYALEDDMAKYSQDN